MIAVDKHVLEPEPADFDAKCRQKGLQWLRKNPKDARKAKRPKDFWSSFRPVLADRFANLCAYGAMYEPVGTVDHFRPVSADETLAYEWRNYRYASGWINSSKNRCEAVLDPFEVQPGWPERTGFRRNCMRWWTKRSSVCTCAMTNASSGNGASG